MRRLMIAALTYIIHFHAEHIPGLYNTAADLLSRFQIQQFKVSFPEMDNESTAVLQTSLHLWEIHKIFWLRTLCSKIRLIPTNTYFLVTRISSKDVFIRIRIYCLHHWSHTSLYCFLLLPKSCRQYHQNSYRCSEFYLQTRKLSRPNPTFPRQKTTRWIYQTQHFCWCKTAYHAFNLEKINRGLAPHFKLNIY